MTVTVLLTFVRAVLAAPMLMAENEKPVTVTLPRDTVFMVEILNTISSESNRVGDPVPFEVLEDVAVGGHVVVRKGTKGRGVLSEVKSRKSFGRSGKLDINFGTITAVDGGKIPVLIGKRAAEENKKHAVILPIIGLLVFWPLLLFGFKKGKEAVISGGTQLYIQTNADAGVLVNGTAGPELAVPVAVDRREPGRAGYQWNNFTVKTKQGQEQMNLYLENGWYHSRGGDQYKYDEDKRKLYRLDNKGKWKILGEVIARETVATVEPTAAAPADQAGPAEPLTTKSWDIILLADELDARIDKENSKDIDQGEDGTVFGALTGRSNLDSQSSHRFNREDQDGLVWRIELEVEVYSSGSDASQVMANTKSPLIQDSGRTTPATGLRHYDSGAEDESSPLAELKELALDLGDEACADLRTGSAPKICFRINNVIATVSAQVPSITLQPASDQSAAAAETLRLARQQMEKINALTAP